MTDTPYCKECMTGNTTYQGCRFYCFDCDADLGHRNCLPITIKAEDARPTAQLPHQCYHCNQYITSKTSWEKLTGWTGVLWTPIGSD
jgi:hypothetical protein